MVILFSLTVQLSVIPYLDEYVFMCVCVFLNIHFTMCLCIYHVYKVRN